MKSVIIATKNRGKAKEFEELFAPLGYSVLTLLDLEDVIDVEETGKTFEENAMLKATTISKLMNIPVLADDSGLIVDTLDGRPGVYSARYAGEPKSDKANYEKLLLELQGVPHKERKARFYCSIVLVGPSIKTISVSGTCEGYITEQPIGENGFGYDPVFYVPDKQKTMAQLTAAEKNIISHRAKAVGKLKEKLLQEGGDAL